MAEASGFNVLSPAKVWEVDFCSRPLLDERGKKVWELLITDADRKLQYSEFFPNNKINSQEARSRRSRPLAQHALPVLLDRVPAAV